MHVEHIIRTHPQVRGSTNDALIQCIEECFDCAQVCTVCADACLGEQMIAELRQCIRLNLDCADICTAAGHIASRRTGSNEAVILATLAACETACRLCVEECLKHASMHEHCRICAESCQHCADACIAASKSITQH